MKIKLYFQVFAAFLAAQFFLAALADKRVELELREDYNPPTKEMRQ